MKRILLIILVISSLFSLAYFGYELTKQNELTNSPQHIFNENDKKVIRINRINEFINSQEFESLNNILINELTNFSQQDLYNIGVYASANRSILLFDRKEGWNKTEAKRFTDIIKIANISSTYKGRFLVMSKLDGEIKPSQNEFSFTNGDIKASYNIWAFDSEWIKTDVYNLNKGYFEYRTASSESNVGVAINDVEIFSSVLPENIASYTFSSRFYAELNDSIYKSSPMSKWVNQGFIYGVFEGEPFLISDNRPQQTPALLLLEASESADETDYISEVKVFQNIQLTTDFPKGNTIYLIEIEDKTIIAEQKEIAEKISLIYNLGETLALNKTKKEQFFQGLPSSSHYRMVNESEKRSKTWKNKIVFEVATLPPGENLIMTETKNWTFNPHFSKVKKIVPIKDHIRGGASIFITDEKGGYELVSQSGNSIFEGSVENPIIGKPVVIDIFDNDKKQLLFRTQYKVFVLALNGELLSGFPYVSDHEITTNINPFRWSNTFRCIFGNEKGEIVMLNQKGGELNIIQASSSALTQDVFALNIVGNLRSWFIDENNNTGLAYLETPAKAQVLFKNNTTFHVKKGSEVFSFLEHDGQVKLISSTNSQARPFAEGKIINTTDEYLVIKNGNQINFYDFSCTLLSNQTIGFNEVGAAHRFIYKGKQYTGVYDYLENNYYLYDGSGSIIDGFPKESRKFVECYLDTKNSIINIFTIINSNVICYKYKIVS